MSELEAATRLKPTRASNLLLYTILGLFLWLLVWASFSEVEERTRGIGQVMPSSDMQVIQSLEGGILSELMVNEGDRVEKGQILMRIDDVFFASEERGMEVQMLSYKVKQARLLAEASNEAFVMPEDIVKKVSNVAKTEQRLYKSRQEELKTSQSILEDEVQEVQSNLEEVQASISKLSKGRDLLKKELDIAKRLVAQKAMPEIEKIRLEREMNNITGDLETARKASQGLKSKLSATKKKSSERLSAFKSEALGELKEIETRIAAMEEGLKSAGDRVRRAELRAPVDGVVQSISIKTIGGVIEPAKKLIEIVPVKDALMVRAKISPADIAFVKLGQDVRVSITAYDSSLYGSLKGQLERISADTIQEPDGNIYFEIDVITEKGYLGTEDEKLPIAPGMVAETEVITGKRTILTYLLKPILRARSRVFTER